MADKNKKIIFTVEVNDKGKVKVDNLTKGFVSLDSAVKKVNKSIIDQSVAMNQVTKTNQNMIDKTGLAGATLVELGRTISDSNYGIRGMANNLSQLSTLMITLISTTGGVANGIKALTAAFMGPLGFIIGFQIVIALLEKFDMQSSQTERSINNIGTASAGAGSNLKILRDVMDDNSLSTKELERAVNKANSEYKDLNIQIDETGRVTKESRKQIDDKILSLERLAKATAIQKEMEELFGKIVANEIEEKEALRLAEVEGIAVINALRGTQEGNALATLVEMTVGEEAIREKRIERIKENAKEERNILNQRVEDLKGMVVGENLLDEMFKSLRDGTGARSRKESLAGQLDFEKEIIKSQGRISESLIVNNQLRVKEEFETIRELAVLKQKDFAEDQQRKVNLIKDDKLRAQAQKKVNKEIADSEKSLVDYIIQLRRERDSVITQMNIEDLSKAAAMQEDQLNIRKKSAAEFNSFLALTNKQRFDADIELEKLKTEIIIQELEQQIEAKRIAGEDTRGIEEKIDTLREKLSQKQIERGVKFIDEEAKRINEIIKATQGAFAQLSNVFTSYTDARIEALKRERDYVLNSETLTGEAQKKRIEDIQRRELQAQKNKIRLERELFTIKQSMLIAEQVMKAKAVLAENAFKLDVALSDIGTEAAVQAGKAKMSIGTFVSQGGAAGLAAYAITIGGLLASIFAARKKAKSQIASLGGPSRGSIGGAGGGSSVEAPDFNVVGASPESQLAQSVSEQQTQPLRAFVVHKDIKDANELDRNIDVTRTLG
jgi:hypothetical protein